MGGEFFPPPSLSVFAYAYLTQFWLTVSVIYDIFLGAAPFFVLVVIWPRFQKRAKAMIEIQKPPRKDFEAISSSDWLTVFSNKIAKAFQMKPKKGPYIRPAHLHTWLFFNYLQVNCWGAIIGVFADLALSIGWHDPRSWDGLYYDLIFARANGQPNGAHIVSYIGLPVFALAVAYKFGGKGFAKLYGDSFQGASAAGFLGGIHELIWMGFRFSVYGIENVLSEEIRDLSFAIMCVLLIATFWKFPGRQLPLNTFKWPVVVYFLFCLGWCVIPVFFGIHPLPITTINDPRLANNIYEQTQWYSIPWVQAAETVSWVILWASSTVLVARFRGKENKV